MNVETILRYKGRTVATIRPEDTVGAAVDALVSGNAVDDGRVAPQHIVLELALQAIESLHAASWRSAISEMRLTVAEVMTRPVVTCDPTQGVAELMAEMTNRRIRHFPVVRNGRLCGIVSIGDVVKNRLDEIEYEASSLRSFIAGA